MNNGYINRTICVAAANRVSGIRSKVTSSSLFRPLSPPLLPDSSSLRRLAHPSAGWDFFFAPSSPSPSPPPPPPPSSFVAPFALVTGEKCKRDLLAFENRARWRSAAFVPRYSQRRSSLSRVRDVDAPMSNGLCLDFDELARPRIRKREEFIDPRKKRSTICICPNGIGM